MGMRFATESGVVVPSVTTDEMREVDRIAIDETGPNLFQMMENAGRNLASVALSILGDAWRDAAIVVLAGTGGNGGGGIAAGRHLANRGGQVTVVATDPDRLGEVPAAQLALFDHTGGRRGDLDAAAGADLVIDAVIGYSLRGVPRGAAAAFIASANASDAAVLSLDVPSGVEATSGTSPGDAVVADVTMTLALPKTGLARAETGRLLLADIGIPAEVYRRLGKPLVEPIFDGRWVVPLTRRPEPGQA